MNRQYSKNPPRVTDQQLQLIALKFLSNLPTSETRQQRIWTHVQKAFFYYIDHIIKINPKQFDSYDGEMLIFLKHLKPYFPYHISFYEPHHLVNLVKNGYSFTHVCGVVLLNKDQSKVLMVQSQPPSLMFGLPKGKINEGETPERCASRQVLQQVGIHVTIDRKKVIEIVNNKKQMTFFICKIQERSVTERKANHQISSIQWYSLKGNSPNNAKIQSKMSNSAKMILKQIRQSNKGPKKSKKGKSSDKNVLILGNSLQSSLKDNKIQFKPFAGYDRQKLLAQLNG